jgi:type IV pilus assembly protein PilA
VLAATILIGALGLTALRTYTVRAQIADSVALAAPIQEHVIRAFRRMGMPPADRREAGLAPDGRDDAAGYVASLGVVNGRVEITFADNADPAIAGSTLSLTPFETADQQIVWLCGNKIAGVGLKPLGFAGGARQAVQVLTAVEARYLPSTCR